MPSDPCRSVRPPADFARLAGRLHQAVVQPIFGLRLAVAAFALGDFVFMVREDEIEPAAVDVERFAQACGGSWPSIRYANPAGPCPRAVPRRLARLGAFPEGEIGGRTFSLGHSASFALQAVDRAPAELAVVGVAADVEINISGRYVGESAVDQRLREAMISSMLSVALGKWSIVSIPIVSRFRM